MLIPLNVNFSRQLTFGNRPIWQPCSDTVVMSNTIRLHDILKFYKGFKVVSRSDLIIKE